MCACVISVGMYALGFYVVLLYLCALIADYDETVFEIRNDVDCFSNTLNSVYFVTFSFVFVFVYICVFF